MAASDGLNDYQFRISHTQKKIKGVLRNTAMHIEATRDEESAGSLSFRRMASQPGDVGRHWAAPSVSVEPDHQQQGLATEMVRRLTAMNPTDTFNWHDFSSEGGLAVGRRASEENPRQHILREDFSHGND
jgi:GNAT superfamily N-acetyltransferase